MKLYYKIMVSSIYTAQNNGSMSSIWKFASNFYFAFASANYIMFFYLIFNNHICEGSLDFLILKIISIKNYNFIINMFLYFIIPIMSINYLLIYQESKYKQLIKEYTNNYNKKLFALYFIMAIVFMFLILFLK